MNNTFSLQRLWWLIRKQGTENARFYKLGIPALVGLLSFVFLFFLTVGLGNDYSRDYNAGIFLTGLYVIGIGLASTSFTAMHQKRTGNQWLSLPASALEKLLCAVFYHTIVFGVLYTVCFLLVKNIAMHFVTSFEPDYYHKLLPGSFFQSMGASRLHLGIFFAFFPVQAFFIAGAAWCSRYAFIKSTIAGAILFIFPLMYFASLTKAMMGAAYTWHPGDIYHSVKVTNLGEVYKIYTLPTWVYNGLEITLFYGLVLICWVIAWYRLKEKQL